MYDLWPADLIWNVFLCAHSFVSYMTQPLSSHQTYRHKCNGQLTWCICFLMLLGFFCCKRFNIWIILEESCFLYCRYIHCVCHFWFWSSDWIIYPASMAICCDAHSYTPHSPMPWAIFLYAMCSLCEYVVRVTVVCSLEHLHSFRF